MINVWVDLCLPAHSWEFKYSGDVDQLIDEFLNHELPFMNYSGDNLIKKLNRTCKRQKDSHFHLDKFDADALLVLKDGWSSDLKIGDKIYRA